MGELAVLHTQDCLRDHLPRQKPNTNSNSKTSNRRKRSPEKKNNNNNNKISNNFPAKKPVMGQVKILKRGEQLTTAMKNRVDENNDLVVPKQKRIGDFYAGSACFSSPSPSSLPLPAFFTKKSVLGTNNSDATTDLRRLLGLDLL